MRQPGTLRRTCVSLKFPSFSQVVDHVVDLIVGKGAVLRRPRQSVALLTLSSELADRRDLARYSRDLAGAEARNRAVTSVACESPPPLDDPTKWTTTPLLERTKSIAGTIPRQGSIRPLDAVRRPEQVPALEAHVWSQGPPDISCADISEEQMARTYSKSCVWDPKINPVPPLQEMEGFGRFRRSVHANADWELNKFRDDLQTLGPAAVQHLGDFEIARLKKGVMDHIRTPSYASLTSRSDSECSSEGHQICRGFDTSKISQMTKRCKLGSVSMIDMGTRAISAGLNGKASLKWQPGSTRISFLRTDRGPNGPLLTSNATAAVRRKKIIVPLTFDPQVAPDQVIEDDNDGEYESCEPSFADATTSTKNEHQSTATGLVDRHDRKAQLLQMALPNRPRGPRHHRDRECAADRAFFGQKKATKSGMRRVGSRGTRLGLNHAVLKENIAQIVPKKGSAELKLETSSEESKLPFADFISEESQTVVDGSSGVRQPSLIAHVVDHHAQMSGTEENVHQAIKQNSSSQAADLRYPGKPEPPKALGRNRSDTVIRVGNENDPIVHLEGDVQRKCQNGEILGKKLTVEPAC